MRAGADRLQPLAVADHVGAADARGAARAVARAGADRAVAGQQVRARADQPVVVRREVAGQAADGGLVDQRGAEVVEVVEVDDVGAQAVQRGGERAR